MRISSRELRNSMRRVGRPSCRQRRQCCCSSAWSIPACAVTLIDYWQRKDKISNRGGRGCRAMSSTVMSSAATDVQLDDPEAVRPVAGLPGAARRAGDPRAFHINIMVIEAPIIGCYDAESGGRFALYRDNTSSLYRASPVCAQPYL